ncbi:TVP38/TMEM64 family protein [Sporosalibacterium faouarense]|uniref:TVP38/TMEM64 family protein n=1 Tax=Sporosalibacterium faouarense TaxID=516123 RepID=UPI00141D062A|nr:TVP38/TMEM64 family protein [Sporosalibacterium faouarense]MTI49663.1 TVP38/TMEM64 family protein [Bacillota bacterium]
MKNIVIIFIKYNKKLLKKLTSKEIRNSLFAIIIVITLIIFVKYSNLSNFFTVERVKELKYQIEEYGFLGQLFYIVINILTGFIGFPVVIIKFMGGLIFGTLWGMILTTIGSTIGAILSFLFSRYLAKDFAKKILSKNDTLKRIYEGVENTGWETLIATRLIPIFPYSLQNYVYGITDMKLSTYIIVTFIFMLPSNFGISFLAESAVSNKSILFAVCLYILTAITFGAIGIWVSICKSNREFDS